MDLDKRLFLSIPRTFRSSMPMMENLLASDVVRACLETHLSIMKRFNSMLAMAI